MEEQPPNVTVGPYTFRLHDEIGIDVVEIKEKLGDRYPAFEGWFYGQTGAISDDGRMLVYPHDLKRFLDHRPAFD